MNKAWSREHQVGLLFALVTERLRLHYEHQLRLTQAQGASLAADWLARNKLALPLTERRALADLSDTLASDLIATLPRAAGLATVHEMTEGLDSRYRSALVIAMLEACEAQLDSAADTAEPGPGELT